MKSSLRLSGLAAAFLLLAACTHDKPQIVNEELAAGTTDLWVQKIGIAAFSDASWDRFGFYDKEGAFEHQYGGNDAGFFEYSFQGPDQAVRQLVVQSRLSAESNEKGKLEEISDVSLKINGVEVGTQTVQADDMKGRVYTWKIKDAAVLQKLKLKAGARNILRFEVEADARNRHGLCLYGESIDGAQEGQPIVLQMTPR